MRLIVGLGNPGRRYERTRHNVGYRLVALLADRFGASWQSSRFDADMAQPHAPDVLLVRPTTFMNESGRAVGAALRYYQVPLDDLLVVCDDLDLGLGQIRLRARGGSGGQNGLRSIAQHLNSQDYSRLRIGIGRPPGIDAADHVLGTFTAPELALIDEALVGAADAAECWVQSGIETAMNQFNAKQAGAS